MRKPHGKSAWRHRLRLMVVGLGVCLAFQIGAGRPANVYSHAPMPLGAPVQAHRPTQALADNKGTVGWVEYEPAPRPRPVVVAPSVPVIRCSLGFERVDPHLPVVRAVEPIKPLPLSGSVSGAMNVLLFEPKKPTVPPLLVATIEFEPSRSAPALVSTIVFPPARPLAITPQFLIFDPPPPSPLSAQESSEPPLFAMPDRQAYHANTPPLAVTPEMLALAPSTPPLTMSWPQTASVQFEMPSFDGALGVEAASTVVPVEWIDHRTPSLPPLTMPAMIPRAEVRFGAPTLPQPN